MARRPEDIRNIAFFGHVNTGKTALIDALAHVTGITKRQGDSADGSSVSNTEPEEKERTHTLTSHVFHFPLGQSTLNAIDTPGYPEFEAEAISIMPVVETACLCVNAMHGLTFHGRQIWKSLREHDVCRAILVTHIDNENANFDDTIAELQSILGDRVVPVTYPDQSGPGVSAVHDVLEGQGPKAGEYREMLEERVAEADDELMERYLATNTMTRDEIDKFFAPAMAMRKFIPVFTVVPNGEIGFRKLCKYIEADFPSPVGYGPRAASKADAGPDANADQIIEATEDGPFAARVFKVVVDPYVGRLSYLRCMRGKFVADSGFLNVRTGVHEKVPGLLGIQGKETEPVGQVVAGDVFAVAKLETLELNDTVTADDAPVRFAPPTYPESCYSLSVVPATRGDEQKINQGLDKLSAEDPSFHYSRSEATGEQIITGMSPLHLEIQLARLERRYGVKTETSNPRVPYLETIRSPADGHHRHKKQSGGKGQFAEVFLRAKPRSPGEGFEFHDGVVGGSVPKQFIPEAEKGVRRLMERGVLAGCTIVDVSVELYDGKFHDVDSDALSFQLAGERAFLDAFQAAKPVLLEPIMEVEIHVPDRFTGDVAGSLSSIRGRMAGMDLADGIQVITAHVPLKEMQDYATQLRSITAGEGTFIMRPHGHEQVPTNLQQEIVAVHKAAQKAVDH